MDISIATSITTPIATPTVTPMKVDVNINADLGGMAQQIPRLEAMGYDGVRIAELNHDPFLALTLAAEHSQSMQLMTSVAVAFARNPMTMAMLGHDLNAFSRGRLVLGLGSQVKPHIERRFSMPWHKAAKQMREFICAMRAIYDCWYDNHRLDFVGDYYQHTLMPATFMPENIEFGRPRIHLSATGPLMTRVAAEVADGMIMHPFSTQKFIEEVTLPAITRGLQYSGRSLSDFELDYAPIVAVGDDKASLLKAIESARHRIAFYGSTEAYRPVLEVHGWGELQTQLSQLNKRRESEAMAALINDEVLHTFAIIGSSAEVIETMKQRLTGLVDRTSLQLPALRENEQTALIERLKA
ncbi:MAG: putative F420-dependent oxidoreductase [Candidatus Azotimanducaceae bacterium]|jgi:probable F420-dependent oxidoreductase